MTRSGGWESTGFGAKLRELRDRAGLTQKRLSELAGCHQQTITKIESGGAEPAWPLVLIFCRVLDVTPMAFLEPAESATTPGRGRPPKPKTDEPEKPKRPRGRPRKEE